MASAARVFTIPELLEMILLRLPERDLLLSQRVKTTWRNITNTSPHLQRKLFYKADVCDPALISDVVWNPLLRSALTKNATSSVLKERGIESTYESVKASSWNDMFLTQPAVSKIYVKFHLNHHGNDEQPVGPELASSQGPVKGTVENPNGVRMEDIRSTEWIDGELAKVEGNRTCFHFRLALYKNFAVSRSKSLL